MKSNVITVLVDNNSWIIPHAQKLVEILKEKGFDATFADNSEKVRYGWVNFMLGCTQIIGKDVLQRNEHNIVVHESDLPQGRGFAPMAWQILKGKHQIPICLIEAADAVDAGDIWLKDIIELNGNELCEEWRALQGEKTIHLCMKFIQEYKTLQPMKQKGETSWYPRRRPADSRLDIDQSLRDQFNLLRIVDNKKYPAFFEINGQTFMLQISKVGDENKGA